MVIWCNLAQLLGWYDSAENLNAAEFCADMATQLGCLIRPTLFFSLVGSGCVHGGPNGGLDAICANKKIAGGSTSILEVQLNGFR